MDMRKLRGFQAIVVLCVVSVSPWCVLGDEPELTEAQQQRYDEAVALGRTAAQLYAAGQKERALPYAIQKAAIVKELRGDTHPEYATSISNIAVLYAKMGDYRQAEPLFRKSLEIRKMTLGEAHPDYVGSLDDLATLYRVQNDFVRAELVLKQIVEVRKKTFGETSPFYATSLNNLAMLYHARGDYTQAEPLLKQSVEIGKKSLGESHPEYANSLNNLATLYYARGDYTQAEELFKQSLQVTKKAFGETHPKYATSLSNLAMLYQTKCDNGQAEPLLLQSLEILKKTSGETNLDYAMSLNNLATLYQDKCEYARAEQLLQQSLEIRKKILGENHPLYAQSLNNVAMFHFAQHDFARAEPLLKQCLEITKKTVGDAHPDYASSLDNLAGLYQAMGDYRREEPLLRQSLEIRKKSLGETHPLFANSLNNLAGFYQDTCDLEQAELLFKQSLEIRKRTLGEKHLDYANSLNNLGELYRAKGDYERAEPLLKQCLEIKKKLGETHPDYANSLKNLGGLYQAMGDYGQAKVLLQQSLDIFEQILQQTANIQFRTQQFARREELRCVLDAYLKLTLAAPLDAKSAYAHALLWKGAVLEHSWAVRLANSQPELKPLFDELERTNTQLAAISFASPPPQQQANWQKRIAELTSEKGHLESELSRRSSVFRAQQQQAQVAPSELQASIPQGVVLVDLWEVQPPGLPCEKQFGGKSECRLAAFVVRPQADIALIDLGPREPIVQAVERWREEIQSVRKVAEATNESPAMVLRRLVWEPLEEHLAGAELVLISPDGPLACVPWAALPGKRPGRYLLEECSIAIVTVPKLLAARAADAAGPSGKSTQTPLLVGDVDFDKQVTPADSKGQEPATAVHTIVRSTEAIKSEPLPGSVQEIHAVGELFSQAHPGNTAVEIRGTDASEDNVRRLAPQHRYVHLATRSFFPPAEIDSVHDAAPNAARGVDSSKRDREAGFRSSLHSGVALAGANRSAQPVTDANAPGDDGILTAWEVAALDLAGTDLVVLSGLETGRGRVAGGEGVLGLQRAFQLAGAKSVAASLWTVDDQATQTLVTEFYTNLWQKKMTKLAALRQAQLTMLQRYDPQEKHLIPIADQPAEPTSPTVGQPPHERLPRYYWAAFVFSGDWR